MIILVVVGAWLAWTVTQQPSVPSGGPARASPAAGEQQKKTVAPMPPLPRMSEAVTAGTGVAAPTRELSAELGAGSVRGGLGGGGLGGGSGGGLGLSGGLGGGSGCYTGFSPFESTNGGNLLAYAQPLA